MDELPAPPGPPAPELRIVESRVYRGPNVWSYDAAVGHVVSWGDGKRGVSIGVNPFQNLFHNRIAY